MPTLFDPLTIRGVTLRNRIGISPMQQYCAADDGLPTDWHMANLLPRAQAGAGLVFAESTAVNREGRIGYGDLGLWDDGQVAAHARLAGALRRAGAVAAVQLGHGGRKSSRNPPWVGGTLVPGWTPVAPSAVAFGDFTVPRAMSEADIATLIADYAAAARRASTAGYQMVELHVAHGYVLHQFLSPLANQRNDGYGGDFAGRTRIVHEVVAAVRAAVPAEMLLALRLSHTDWVPGGWTTEETARLAADLEGTGVDLLDVSSGGMSPDQVIPVGPGYQVPGAQAVKQACSIPVASVGMITEPQQANAIIAEGHADIVLLARGSMIDPLWPLAAAAALGATDAIRIPPQFERGWTRYGKLAIDLSQAAPLEPLA